MIDQSRYIRTDKYYPPNTKSGGRKNVLIYKCITCSNEVKIKARKRLETATGMCSGCNAKTRHASAMDKVRLKPFEAMYNRLCDSANIRNIKIELTYLQLLPFTNVNICHYCLRGVIWKSAGSSTYNLDRKDNNGPYSKDNLVVCCGKCNKGKREIYTYEEWFGMTEYFRKKYA